MPTREISRYAYPIIDVADNSTTELPRERTERKARTATLRLSLCPTSLPSDPPPLSEVKPGAITRWRRPSTVVENTALPDKLDPNLVMLSAKHTSAARSYRLLRHRLIANGDPKIIAVTSATSGEGKTVCAINLALAIGEELGARVLVIEANVFRPSLAKTLGFQPSQCFAEQMANLDGVVQPWTTTKLEGTRVEVAAVDPTIPEHPKMDRVLFSSALGDLKPDYDYIVIDTPPVLESADVNLIADAVDGVVMVARAKKTRKAQLRTAIEQLAPARVLGVALLDSHRAEVS